MSTEAQKKAAVEYLKALASAPVAGDIGKDQELQSAIKSISVLNTRDKTFNGLRLLVGDMAMVSDIDDELLITVEFNERVKITDIVIKANIEPKLKEEAEEDGAEEKKDEEPEESEEDDETVIVRPKLAVLFADRSGMDFSDVADGGIPPTDRVILTSEVIHEGGYRYSTAKAKTLTKFRSVDKVTIYISGHTDEESQVDDAVTHLCGLSFRGDKIASTKMSELKKMPDSG